ncbi:hypothetical protein FACS1894178_7260 [Bacteroidia bacterium]|nr:hypothetical protein FACS1894178_7260 [Bacteroidia bacterium]
MATNTNENKNVNENRNVNTNTNENKNENSNKNEIKKMSFCYGLLGGVVASLIASAIWYAIQKLIEN